MSVSEEHALFCKFIHVGCFGIGVSAEASDPVVQVIYRDEQDIRLITNRDSTVVR